MASTMWTLALSSTLVMRHPYHGHRFAKTVFLKLIKYENQVRVELEPEYENVTDILNFVPGTTAMNLPNTCTIVIIAGGSY